MSIPKMTKPEVDEATRLAKLIATNSRILGTVVDPRLAEVIRVWCANAQINYATFAEDLEFQGLTATQRLAIILAICDLSKSITYYDENAAANALGTDIVFIRKLMRLIFDEIGIDP